MAKPTQAGPVNKEQDSQEDPWEKLGHPQGPAGQKATGRPHLGRPAHAQARGLASDRTRRRGIRVSALRPRIPSEGPDEEATDPSPHLSVAIRGLQLPTTLRRASKPSLLWRLGNHLHPAADHPLRGRPARLRVGVTGTVTPQAMGAVDLLNRPQRTASRRCSQRRSQQSEAARAEDSTTHLVLGRV